jgi:acyl carrier protein
MQIMETLKNDVQQVFRDVFGEEQIVLADDMTADDIPGWDSLGHLNLIIAIEKRFGIKFATAEIARLKDDDQNIGTLLALIARKQG